MTGEGAPLLELRELSVRFRQRGQEVKAVDRVSMTVRAGTSVGLVGESGSGKSTIARAVVGLVPVRSGEITFDGQNITRVPFKVRRRLYREMQLVFQDPFSSLNPDRTIGATLAEPLESFGLKTRDELRRRTAEILAKVHLPAEVAGRFPNELSGGQRQRVAIARALILEPRLVICDEAVSALDLSVQAQILDLLAELQLTLGLTYLFISHDLDVVRHMCDETVVLYRGQVMEIGATSELARSPAHPYTQALQRAAPVPDPRVQRRRRPVDHPLATVPAGFDPDNSCRFSARCAYAIAACWSKRPELRVVGSAAVACDRYPEWCGESKSPTNGGSDPTIRFQLPQVR
jgi:oligopeptide/dipeptide ABC transporter ATP-binding protein